MKHILIILSILFIILVLFFVNNMNSFEIQNFKDTSDISNISNTKNNIIKTTDVKDIRDIQKIQDYNFLSKYVYNINPFNYNYLTNAIPAQNTWGWGTFNTNKMYPNSYSMNISKNMNKDIYREINTLGVGEKCV